MRRKVFSGAEKKGKKRPFRDRVKRLEVLSGAESMIIVVIEGGGGRGNGKCWGDPRPPFSPAAGKPPAKRVCEWATTCVRTPGEEGHQWSAELGGGRGR